MPQLFDALDLGSLRLPNRIALAPLTRCRAQDGDVPHPISVKYYSQRASAGLLITEATNVSPRSCAFEKAPGIYSQDQVSGWKPIADGVHAAGGHIFLQLWHCGRVGADAILNGEPPLSPSGVNDDLDALQVWAQLANGRYARIAATPSREMTVAEIEATIEEYRVGAVNAIRAGLDGVEIHAANGYLPHQFLSPTINRRQDEYGGSLQKRLMFLRRVTEAVTGAVGANRVGVRLSPTAAYNNTRDPDPVSTFSAVAKMLDEFGVAYIHIADTNAWAGAPDMQKLLEIVKPRFRGTLIGNGGITPSAAMDHVQSGRLDAIAFGRTFLANPDLPERIQRGGPFNEPRPVGWYGGDEEGYTDYPSLSDVLV
ncbi:NADPH2 dehydrogenase/N-ethylmaleimide reductase [Trinickia symbiotica]|uniref:Alkene reductase n=1 Tax=Trinickia symbiotica TaxID=863227 RepID=A0A2N7XA56_9BURK|nr:alkene reductase [Trinickia symbiotica]PMS38422.1 alkene reductase [Trinickia symbiotica]PPK46433.1 NADPH2 dehydrogenase/N-ethylmaleimide reductase [Trinickia symbiotica]